MEVMGKYLWIAVDIDEYELPLAVADSAEELGRMFGVTKTTIFNAVGKNLNGKLNGRKYMKVEKIE